MKDNDGVGVCRAPTSVIIVSSPFDDRTSCSEACCKDDVEKNVRSHVVIKGFERNSKCVVPSPRCRLESDSGV